MNRVKFLVFAVVALGLVAWSLKLAPTLGADRNTQDASVALAAVPAAVALKIEARRSELQGAALRLGASNALTNPGPKAPKPEAPTADRFNAVRAAVSDGQADAFKAQLVVAVSNEAGALVAQGAADPAAPPEGFDVAAVTAAGGAGAIVTVFGAPHLFYALPLQTSDKNEVKPAGVAAVGVPLIADAKTFFTGMDRELKLSGVALLAEGKVVALNGDKSMEALAKTLKAGPITPVVEGTLESLGPLALPMMSDLTQQLALRRTIAGTPYEVIATVSSAEGLVALAGFQKFGLGALVGLFLLSIAVTALLKSGEEEGAAMVLPPPMPAPNLGRVTGSIPVPNGLAAPAAPLEATPEPPQAPEASPDDFDFPPSPVAARPVTSQAPAFQPPPPVEEPEEVEPASDPFASLDAAPPPAPPPPAGPTYPTSRPAPPVQTSQQAAFQPTPMAAPAPPPAARTAPVSNPFDDDEGARTMAYPVFKPPPGGNPNAPPPGMDPFAMASAQLSPEEQAGGDSDYNPDATRVAAVPAELIKAARQASTGSTGERPAITPAGRVSSAPRVAAVGANDEERHFQDVFKEFVATREKCKEPADGLTYDKFKAKLLKNKEQLVQKYNCKSVRFQVYVKDGKAALKATPVKD
ncbi:MAG: hypothetical protein JNJ54_07040 [Myxococcaceae bacterium]|nr:hypothetical protein [Myxococcaceae bacterium]